MHFLCSAVYTASHCDKFNLSAYFSHQIKHELMIIMIKIKQVAPFSVLFLLFTISFILEDV